MTSCKLINEQVKKTRVNFSVDFNLKTRDDALRLVEQLRNFNNEKNWVCLRNLINIIENN